MINFAPLADKYPDHPMAKYAIDQRRWEWQAETFAKSVGLHDPAEKLRMMDLGCGFGYLVTHCNRLGHQATGLDQPVPIIEEAARLSGLPIIWHRIQDGVKLPGTDQYDLITAQRLNLIELNGCRWGWPEWERLCADVMDRLRPGGRFVVLPNLQAETDFVLQTEHWRAIYPTAKIEADKEKVTLWKPST